MKVYRYFIITFIIIMIDQGSKLLVHHYMQVHDVISVVGNWFRLIYVENEGMAFGLIWRNEYGKLVLTIFRIAAMFGIAYYMVTMIRRKSHFGFLISLAFILGGAIGNVIDSTFYGVLLQNASPDAPTAWFHGKVIDMLSFSFFTVKLPSWIPLIGGDFEFFAPVFNIADSSIFLGVMAILVFQRTFFKEGVMEKSSETEDSLPIDGTISISGEDLSKHE